MPQCENCQANVLSDAQYCEACGHKIGTEPASKAKATGEAKPGSLRGEVAFLSGAVDQAKQRLENWKQRGDQSKMQSERENQNRQQEVEEQRAKKKGPLASVMQFLLGLAALAAFVYLLVRMPRKTSPLIMMQLWKEIQTEFFPAA